MTVTAKLLYPTAKPGTTDSTLYTAPAAGAMVTEVLVANDSDAPATLTLNIVPSAGAVAATNRVIPVSTFPARSVTTFGLATVLAGASTVHALQGTTGALTVTVSGVEFS